jgi:hypothetical protein
MGIVLTIVLGLVLVTAVATFAYRSFRQSHQPPHHQQRRTRRRPKRTRRRA